VVKGFVEARGLRDERAKLAEVEAPSLSPTEQFRAWVDDCRNCVSDREADALALVVGEVSGCERGHRWKEDEVRANFEQAQWDREHPDELDLIVQSDGSAVKK
jgi:hypothetical protein